MTILLASAPDIGTPIRDKDYQVMNRPELSIHGPADLAAAANSTPLGA